jgi:hypothetical protein
MLILYKFYNKSFLPSLPLRALLPFRIGGGEGPKY